MVEMGLLIEMGNCFFTVKTNWLMVSNNLDSQI